MRPAAAYKDLMAPQQQLLDVCAAAFGIRQEEPGTSNLQCSQEAVQLNAEDADEVLAAQLTAVAEAKLAAIDQVRQQQLWSLAWQHACVLDLSPLVPVLILCSHMCPFYVNCISFNTSTSS